jgi:magnesium-transporting ATPase (P-type)
MKDTEPSESKVSLVFRTFMAFPMFLILTVIFWMLDLGAWLLSGWFYERGWSVLGFSAKIVWILLAVLTAFLTVRVFVGWVVHLIQVMRGRES